MFPVLSTANGFSPDSKEITETANASPGKGEQVAALKSAADPKWNNVYTLIVDPDSKGDESRKIMACHMFRIDKEWLITAKHCVEWLKENKKYAVMAGFGPHNIFITSFEEVKSLLPSAKAFSFQNNDIALIHIEQAKRERADCKQYNEDMDNIFFKKNIDTFSIAVTTLWSKYKEGYILSRNPDNTSGENVLKPIYDIKLDPSGNRLGICLFQGTGKKGKYFITGDSGSGVFVGNAYVGTAVIVNGRGDGFFAPVTQDVKRWILETVKADSSDEETVRRIASKFMDSDSI